MQKISVYIVDDEAHQIAQLTRYVQRTPFLQLAGSHTSPIQALDYLTTHPVHLALLDISMPELSGIELMKLLHSSTGTRVIFTTGYSQHAAESYNHDVIDYLLKPFEYERFLKAMLKARDLLQSATTPPATLTHLFIPGSEKNQKRRVELNSIYYIESNKNYTIFHCTDTNIITNLLLKEVEELLPHSAFMRVHRSYIIALQHIEIINSNELVMKNNSRIPIGDSYRETIMKRLG
jgi:two-component system, LytTR family, response regulator